MIKRRNRPVRADHTGSDASSGLEPDLRAILEHGVEAASTANTAFALDNTPPT
jgi:hypothetical protein